MNVPYSGAAFPGSNNVHQAGMTLRDYFASAALTGIMSRPEHERADAENIPLLAYALADAMLAERAK